MAFKINHDLVLAAKRLIYAGQGEPYAVAGTTLRFTPGLRPVRTKYRNSSNVVSRYDALQIEYLCDNLRDGDFAIDVGAHAGQLSLIMATRCGERGRVIAFEPDYHSREKFADNLALNPSVPPPCVEPMALADQPGSAILYSRGGDSNSSLSIDAISRPAGPMPEEIEATLCTLNDYLRDNGLPAPDLLKIDTEGAEIRILKGASSVLNSDALILCELHPYAWPGFGNTFAELEEIVARSGRRMRYLDEDQPLSSDPTYGIVHLEKIA